MAGAATGARSAGSRQAKLKIEMKMKNECVFDSNREESAFAFASEALVSDVNTKRVRSVAGALSLHYRISSLGGQVISGNSAVHCPRELALIICIYTLHSKEFVLNIYLQTQGRQEMIFGLSLSISCRVFAL